MASEELTMVGKIYEIQRKIGSGSFGEIYLARNTRTGEEVAVKLESTKVARYSQTSCNSNFQLMHESKIYESLTGVVGIPQTYYHGKESDYNVLVIELLSKSLESLFEDCCRRFNLKTVLMLADQILCRLEILHTKCYIHRDIKPDNFMMGRGGDKNLVRSIFVLLSEFVNRYNYCKYF